MEFQKLVERAIEIRKQYSEKEQNFMVLPGQVKKSPSDLSVMLVIWQNLSLQKMGSEIFPTAGKNWNMNYPIVCGQ